MLINLILTALCGVTGIVLLEKWKVDDYMNTHRFFSRFWPGQPCLLCRGFWIGVIVYFLLVFVPDSVYFIIPFAAIPLQLFFWQIVKKLV